MPIHAPRSLALLESALRHERWISGGLALAAGACWTWIIVLARDMYGPMSGASARMMAMHADPAGLLLTGAMWVAMMTAMMLPSAAPVLLLYAGALRTRGTAGSSGLVYAMAAGYLLAWTAFCVGATALQWILARALVMTPMMEPASPVAAALVLALAGVYQLTPQKSACLRACRSPMASLLHHWRDGAAGAVRMGLRHGFYCVGCCWALMLLLFAGGVMNLAVIVVLTAWVLVEKLAPFGERTARIGGLLLLALAAWLSLA